MGLPLIRDEDGIRWITLDRPEIRNALQVEDLDAITDGVQSASSHVRAIILTGTGDRAFSAGMHVKTFADATPQSARESIARVRDCVGAIRLSPVPTVALINGYCIGAAFEMALACDLRVAHPDVQFGLPEVKLGIPSVVDAALLHQYVGLSKAKEIILTGEMYPLSDFAHTGMANRIVDASELSETALAFAKQLGSYTPQVMAAQKGLFETWLNTSLQEGIDASVDVFANLFAHPETIRAIAQYQPAPRRSGDR
ncbi:MULTISPECIES: enoyl-CoA hydratase/isomerase family protein [Tsukamurella]|uniref:Enoyl-CoA hydratase/isomerase family protein n=2 Tax=Tsukamurella TaxID=2060 RepID=A0A5C5S025_9ACTN|nr:MULTISPECIES: enoyl-CoA hydratase/isomerase family protein [Tsukamurella]NMD55926.1 enoyl-CoA hydratase/isomerase family protein [Tsukamurella columbiensis]TWS27611.1 enoyl-CoA hydratase/isomerase family protein [Tsukamurella conjunctivitidis]